METGDAENIPPSYEEAPGEPLFDEPSPALIVVPSADPAPARGDCRYCCCGGDCYTACGATAGPDHCRLTCCAYPNGTSWVLTSQLLLVTAIFASLAAMTDCQFVTAVLDDTTDYSHEIPDFLLPTDGILDQERRGYGFYFFEDPNENVCFWVSTNRYDGDALDQYFVFMGEEWLAPRATASLACGIAILLTLWLCAWACVAHIRIFRIIVLAIIWGILVPFQISVLAVLNSEFCDAFDCRMNRSGWFAILAFALFLIVGVSMCFTRSYVDEKFSIRPSTTNRGVVEMVADPSHGQSTDFVREDVHDGIGDAEEIPAADFTVIGALAPTAVPISLENERQNGSAAETTTVPAMAVVVEDASADAVPIVPAKQIHD